MAATTAHAGPAPSAAGAGSSYLSVAKDVIAGTAGGVSVTLVGHPFDTLKVRLQTQPTTNPIYSGVVDCARKTIQWEGIGGLYKGVASPLAGQMVFRASLFSTFGAAKRWLGTDPSTGLSRPLSTADFYKAGAITGFVAAFSEGPIDFYKSQIQVQIVRAKTDANYKPPYTTVGACVRATLRENGFRGPFQGLGATILRNTPANAVYLGSFEVMKRAACEKLSVASPADLPAWAVLGSAGLGGIMYWAVIFPVDCVKSAMQTDTIVRADRKYTGMAQTAGALWREGGVKRFYRGFAPCLIRAAPANASMLFTVEAMHNLMAGVGEEDKAK